MSMKVLMDNTIHSKVLLKPEMRKPFQTTGFIYQALDVAEKQIEEQQKMIESLILENTKLKKRPKRTRRNE